MEREPFSIRPHLDLDIFRESRKRIAIRYFTTDPKKDIPFILGYEELIKPSCKTFSQSIKAILREYGESFCFLGSYKGLSNKLKGTLIGIVKEHNAKFK